VTERCLAGSVRTPERIRSRSGITRDVQHDAAATLAGRRRERAEQRLRQAKRTDEICRDRSLEIFTVGIGQKREGSRSKIRGVVHQHIEPAELAEDLNDDGVDVLLPRHVADDAMCAAVLSRHALDAFAAARDEGHACTASAQFANQRQPQT
jgi:hypothetical protein